VACDRREGTRQVLDAVAAMTGRSRAEVTDLFHAAQTPARRRGDADPGEVARALAAVSHRVNLSPLPWPAKVAHLESLADAMEADPPLSVPDSHVLIWRELIRDLPSATPTLDRNAVVLPAMSAAQESAWQVLLDLDQELDQPWSLVGGQMVFLHCAEQDVPTHRSTDDGDVVLGVWTDRDALTKATRLLRTVGFEEQPTSGGYGYRWRHGNATLDLLVPEGVNQQRHAPRTVTGAPSIPTEGGRQALMRTERVPVVLAGRHGYMRRPNLLGAVVIKAAACLADGRDTDRHREDLAMLAELAVTSGLLRSFNQQANRHDRQRIRRALNSMPRQHTSWQLATDPNAAHEALVRLGTPRELRRTERGAT
jgi:hypothetical protein